MTPLFSLYLDLVRIAAALAVFFHHLQRPELAGALVPYPLSVYGVPAVSVFFVISGFVIAFVLNEREKTAASFIASRLARLYSVIIPVVLLTFVFDTIGAAINPVYYQNPSVQNFPPSILAYVSSFFLVQEFRTLGFVGAVPGSDPPFWSLSFEACYYVLAGLLTFVRWQLAIPLALVLLVVGGQTIAAMLPLWLMGFAAYYCPRFKLPPLALIGLAIGSIIGLLLTPKWVALLPMPQWENNFLWSPAQLPRHLYADYIVAILTTLNLLAVRSYPAMMPAILQRFKTLIEWGGKMTFPLYLMHFPALAFFAALPLPLSPAVHGLFTAVAGFCVCMALTPVSEKLRSVLKSRLARSSSV